MTTDFRALCAELLDLLSCFGSTFNIPIETSVVIRARALLAQPEGEELTDEKLLRMAAAEIGEEFTSSWFLTGRNSLNLEVTPLELLNLMKAVLARRPTSRPPVDGELK